MTGSLQIKNNVYYAVLNFKDKDGRRKQKWVSTGLEVKGNKRRAEKVLHELVIEYEGMSYIEPSRVLLCDFVKEWVDLSQSKVQITTYDGYVHMLNKHIYPYLKAHGLILSKIKPIDIQRYHAAKLKEGLSPNTIIKHHAIIRSALQYAVKNSLLKENVADLVDKPKRERYKAEFYDKQELTELLKSTKGSPIEVPIILACYYGLRRSEILGLQWSSIDFANRIISICNKVVRGKDKTGKLVAVSHNKMKSETSNRTLPLCDAMITYLQGVKANIELNQALMGNFYNKDFNDFVCVNSIGNLLQPDYVSDVFGKLLERNCLRHIRFHDLRHSCASLLLSLGYTMKDIQEWLGHSDFMITANTYTHADHRNKVKMINSVQDLFEFG